MLECKWKYFCHFGEIQGISDREGNYYYYFALLPVQVPQAHTGITLAWKGFEYNRPTIYFGINLILKSCQKKKTLKFEVDGMLSPL